LIEIAAEQNAGAAVYEIQNHAEQHDHCEILAPRRLGNAFYPNSGCMLEAAGLPISIR
jgi:hypothetical protein